ncbi:MAG TPA: nickel pincer cofactor biosynthesis protein LarC [Acidobacteriaceae bacterium]|nr:nickel pincer cofactor biosynthesis protein LarC [Acidobacteriaceae bacterium]
MRIAYLECFAGISGDMFLGALVDAGVDPKLFHDAVTALNIGATLEIAKVDRSGISASQVRVLVDGTSAEAATNSTHTHSHSHHEHHSHGRSLSVIRKLIEHAPLHAVAKSTAIRAFELLGESEARIHNVPIETIHFHEVGAVDSIVDIVAGAVGAHALAADSWICSPLNVGGGTVECAHGTFPVPAPATMDLLQGAPTYSSGIQMELVTPTGAALVRALNCTFGPAPSTRVDKIGYGAGSRNPKRFPNVLRLSIGDTSELASIAGDTVVVMETAVDDLNPQVLGDFIERALQAGALDVMCSSVHMKKNRLATLITLLCDRAHAEPLQQLLFRETSTLGVRIREERRACLDRKFVSVQTEWGEIRIKIGLLNGVEVNAAPEYEDCRRCAAEHSVPLKVVMQSALAIYQTTPPE